MRCEFRDKEDRCYYQAYADGSLCVLHDPALHFPIIFTQSYEEFEEGDIVGECPESIAKLFQDIGVAKAVDHRDMHEHFQKKLRAVKESIGTSAEDMKQLKASVAKYRAQAKKGLGLKWG